MSSTPMVADLFELHTSAALGAPTLTRYQEYAARRFKFEMRADLATEEGRFAALVWYIEGYSVMRKPLKVPFSGAQVRWLLEAAAPYMWSRPVARIVETMWRRSPLKHLDPESSEEDFLSIAQWWSTEHAVTLGVEHVLIPDAFVSALSSPVHSWAGDIPICQLLHRHAHAHAGIPWDFSSRTGRLSAYIQCLSSPGGIHTALFFPEKVMQELRRIEPAPNSQNSFFRLDVAQLSRGFAARVKAADAYRAEHRAFRAGKSDVSAAIVNATWETVSARAAPAVKARPPRILSGDGSVLAQPLRLIGPLNSQSGLGQATRMSVEALTSVGVAPSGLDFYLDNPAPRTATYLDGDAISSESCINLLHLNAESVPLAPAYLSSSLFKNSYNIGFFFWELPQAARCHELAIHSLDEIWVSSEFNRQTYAALTDKPVIKLGTAVEPLPEGLHSHRLKVREKYHLPSSSFVFLTTFDSYSFIKRKNPSAVLHSFLRAFADKDDDVRLVIKTHNLRAILGESKAKSQVEEIQRLVDLDGRILLIDETLAYSDLLALKAASDCYVSLHRSEGWGFGALEAMQIGLPVIATAFSGNLEFCNEDTAFNVGWAPLYLEPDDYIFVRPGDYWAEPNVSEAAQLMLQVARHPGEAKEKGAAGRRYVQSHFSYRAVGTRYLDRLQTIAARIP